MKKLLFFILITLLAVPAIAEEHDGLAIRSRMKELKYYRDDVIAEEITDKSLFRSLKIFQAYNGLPITGVPDEPTVKKLFSEEALGEAEYFKSYQEDPSLQPKNTLFITYDSTAESANIGEVARIRFKVKNTSPDRVVEAYEIQAIPYDPWGDRMIPENTVLAVSTIYNVKPGATHYSNRIDLERRQEVYALYVGISRVMYEDGTIINIPENEILYHVWDGPFLN